MSRKWRIVIIKLCSQEFSTCCICWSAANTPPMSHTCVCKNDMYVILGHKWIILRIYAHKFGDLREWSHSCAQIQTTWTFHETKRYPWLGGSVETGRWFSYSGHFSGKCPLKFKRQVFSHLSVHISWSCHGVGIHSHSCSSSGRPLSPNNCGHSRRYPLSS